MDEDLTLIETTDIPSNWKKVKLSDGTLFYAVEYENEQAWDKVKLVLGKTTYTEVKEKFTKENCSDVVLYSNVDNEVIAELFDKKLGNEITLNTDVDQITIHLEKVSEVSSQITDLQSQIKELQDVIAEQQVMLTRLVNNNGTSSTVE